MTESEQHFVNKRNESMGLWALAVMFLEFGYISFSYGGKISEFQWIWVFGWEFPGLPFFDPLLAGFFIAGMIFFQFERLRVPDVEQAQAEFFDALKVAIIFSGVMVLGLGGQKLFGTRGLAMAVGLSLYASVAVWHGFNKRLLSAMGLACSGGLVGTLFFGTGGVLFFGVVVVLMIIGASGYFLKEMGLAILRVHFNEERT